MSSLPRSLAAALALSLVLALAGVEACGGDSSPAPPEMVPEDTTVTIPARGTDPTLDLATWNVQDFGSATGGPTDDLTQRRRVRDVILGSDLDVWGLQEIMDEDDFDLLLEELPGYAGVLADDPSVADGPAYYSGFNDTERKVALVYKTSVLEVLEARIVLTELDHEFAGRPPLEVRTRLTAEGAGASQTITFLVLHAKANAQVGSWQRRAAAAAGLKAYLDSTWPDDPVFVLGDFNDDVDASITPGRDTPYRPFVEAGPLWVFPTAALSAAGETSILGFPDVIDHILASDEGMAAYEEGSALVYRVDSLIPRYPQTVTDHLPVLARFRWSP